MRLTLRTLLAYLDDTLDPAQARQIGEKVAESTVAQELIDKIKRVARKRSLTIPSSTGPESADANLVAEYLDNDLSGDKIAEIEEQALHSDVHLAEIAACHQLLTLIMSEPAKVPPMARQRMYNLVNGPEVDQNRMAPRVAPATLAELDLTDETEENVLVSRRGGPMRLWIAGALVLGLVVVVPLAMWHTDRAPPASPAAQVAILKQGPQATESPKDKEQTKPAELLKDKEPTNPAEQPKDKPPEQSKEKTKPTDPPANPPKEADKVAAPTDGQKTPPPPPRSPDLAAERKPSDDRKEVGKLTNSGVLLQAIGDPTEWKRVPAGGSIVGTTRLLSLPGVRNEVRLGDVVLELFGTMAEIHQDPLFESSATVFAPPAKFAADVRLDRGRVYLRSNKPTGAAVRLRLDDDLFDITFADDKSEIMAERTSVPDGVPYSRDHGKQQSPAANGTITATQGQATIRHNLKTEAMLVTQPKPTMWRWSSTGAAEKPDEQAQPSPLWSREPNVSGPERPGAVEMEQAVKRLPRQFGDASKPINVAISELLIDPQRMTRRIGLFCQASLDDLSVLDFLDHPTNPELRPAAISAVRNWLGRSADRAGLLADALIKQRRFTEAEAEAALALWFGFSESALTDPKTYAAVLDALSSDKLAVRDLAHWRLTTQLDPEGAKIIRYVATDPPDIRQRAVQEWKRRIPDGQLPPGRMK
jgi:hypothetical protein